MYSSLKDALFKVKEFEEKQDKAVSEIADAIMSKIRMDERGHHDLLSIMQKYKCEV